MPADSGWPDRRPIDVVMFADPAYRTKANPRGWNPNVYGNLDASAPDYPQRFRVVMGRFIDACVLRARTKHGGQVGLFWDIEGQEFDHPVSYLGDPRILPPEMAWRDPAEVAAAKREGRNPSTVPTTAQFLCRKFTDAGMLAGGTVRPQVCIRTPYGARQTQAGEPLVILTDKISYARRELGWRVFYVDSSVEPDAWTTTTKEGKADPHPLPPELFRKLGETFPDCLFIPEFAHDGYAAVPRVAPLRFHGNPSRQPFEVLKPTNNVPTAEDVAEYVRAMRAGAVTLVAATWDSAENVWAIRAYREARREQANVPPDGKRP